MKISLPNVTIVKDEDKYRFIGIIGSLHLSLGAYGSIQEGVSKILEKGKTKLIFLTQLEQFYRTGMALGWDEEKLLTAF